MEWIEAVPIFLDIAKKLMPSGGRRQTITLEVGGHHVKIVNGQVVEGSFEEIVKYLMSKDINTLKALRYFREKQAQLPIIGTPSRIMVSLIDKAIELKTTPPEVQTLVQTLNEAANEVTMGSPVIETKPAFLTTEVETSKISWWIIGGVGAIVLAITLLMVFR